MFNSYTENTLRFFPEKCINCRRCTEVCPHGVFAEGSIHAELVATSDCMECGACAKNCPVQAIEVLSGVRVRLGYDPGSTEGKGHGFCRVHLRWWCRFLLRAAAGGKRRRGLLSVTGNILLSGREIPVLPRIRADFA